MTPEVYPIVKTMGYTSDYCTTESVTWIITVTVNNAGLRRISVSPTNECTCANVEAMFTINATGEKGGKRQFNTVYSVLSTISSFGIIFILKGRKP